jgi:hypothetical protein
MEYCHTAQRGHDKDRGLRCLRVSNCEQTCGLPFAYSSMVGGPLVGVPLSKPSRRQILVVDDNAHVRQTLVILLTAARYDVVVAEDGIAALL